MKRFTQNGFSLVEILITLAILGVLATFAIPKLLFSTNEAQRHASFKQGISTMQQTLFEGAMSHKIDPNNMSDYFSKKLNFQKEVAAGGTGCVAEGIMAANPSSPYKYWDDEWVSDVGHGGGILADGTTICGFINTPCPLCCAPDITHPLPSSQGANMIVIDWNGTRPPNITGQDRLWIVLSYGTSDAVGTGCSPGPMASGTITALDNSSVLSGSPDQAISAVNVALYKEMKK